MDGKGGKGRGRKGRGGERRGGERVKGGEGEREWREREGRGGERKRRDGKGQALRHFSFYNLTTNGDLFRDFLALLDFSEFCYRLNAE